MTEAEITSAITQTSITAFGAGVFFMALLNLIIGRLPKFRSTDYQTPNQVGFTRVVAFGMVTILFAALPILIKGHPIEGNLFSALGSYWGSLIGFYGVIVIGIFTIAHNETQKETNRLNSRLIAFRDASRHVNMADLLKDYHPLAKLEEYANDLKQSAKQIEAQPMAATSAIWQIHELIVLVYEAAVAAEDCETIQDDYSTAAVEERETDLENALAEIVTQANKVEELIEDEANRTEIALKALGSPPYTN